MFQIIAAIGKNREIGQKGQLIWRLPQDLAFFRQQTSGHPILMGRKTWQSLPHKLPGRRNLVVSAHQVAGADDTVTDLPKFIAEHASDSAADIYVIGGAMLYAALLPYTSTLYLTEIDSTCPTADAFFPAFNLADYAKTVLKTGTDQGLKFTIAKYVKKGPPMV